jgi:hypothetical protein
MSGPRREDEPEWGVLTYNLALAKFQQRHILQVTFYSIAIFGQMARKIPFQHCYGARAEEPKLKYLPDPEPKLQITAPAPDPDHLIKDLKF